MASTLAARTFFDPTILAAVLFFTVVRLATSDDTFLIHALSYAVHCINILAFSCRTYEFPRFAVHSFFFRALALLTLGIVMAPYLANDVRVAALFPFLGGIVLHAASVRTLGFERTYYGVELGAAPPLEVHGFPYNVFRHPMAIGSGLTFVGVYLLSPAFAVDYPWLVPGHIALTALTAWVESLDGRERRAPTVDVTNSRHAGPPREPRFPVAGRAPVLQPAAPLLLGLSLAVISFKVLAPQIAELF